MDLANARQIGMSLGPISYSDIRAYAELMQVPMEPWEVRAIRRIDDAVIQVYTAKQSKPKEESKPDLPPGKAVVRKVKADDVDAAKAFFSSFGKGRK